MKDLVSTLLVCVTVLFGVAMIVSGPGVFKWDNRDADAKQDNAPYDPNAPEYKYVPQPPEGWTKAFGSNERARLLYAISETRAALKVVDTEMKLKAETASAAIAALQQRLDGGVPGANEVTP